MKRRAHHRCGRWLRENPQFLWQSQFVNSIFLGAWHTIGPQFNMKGTEGGGKQVSHLKGQQQPFRMIKSVTELRSSCSPLKNQYPRGSWWWKGKLLLIRKPVIWEEGRPVSPKTNSEDSARS